MKTIFTTLLFLILTTQAIGGLFVGVAIVDGGLAILQPSEAGVGSGRIVNQVRLELGDLIKVGDDGVCRVCFIDGTTVNLLPDSEYRVTREGLWKVLDGGEMVVADFKMTLGSKTQSLSVKTGREKLGELNPIGKCEYKNSYESEWTPVTKGTPFYSGGMIKTGADGQIIITYNNLSLFALIEPDSFIYCLRDGVNFEKGRGLVSVPSNGGTFIFDASMSRIRVRTNSALFYFQELADGASLSVYRGRLQLALKAQGLSNSVTMGPGFKAVLKRSGLIEKPKKFGDPDTFKDSDKFIVDWFTSGNFEGLRGLLEGPSSELEGRSSEFDSSEDAKGVKVLSESSQVTPEVTERPTAIPAGAASDLEKLFQLPRMDRADQTRSRPDQ